MRWETVGSDGGRQWSMGYIIPSRPDFCRLFFIRTEKARAREKKWDGVGIMKDKELKLEGVEAPHTLGGESYVLFK